MTKTLLALLTVTLIGCTSTVNLGEDCPEEGPTELLTIKEAVWDLGILIEAWAETCERDWAKDAVTSTMYIICDSPASDVDCAQKAPLTWDLDACAAAISALPCQPGWKYSRACSPILPNGVVYHD